MFSNLTIKKAINLELDEDKMLTICNDQNFEKGDYYDYNLFMKVLSRFANKEITTQTFRYWCTIVSIALINIKGQNESTKLGKAFASLSDFIDGASFFNDDCDIHEIIAEIKYFNHQIQNIVNNKNQIFAFDGVERYLCLDHCNWTSNTKVYRVLIIDHNKKMFDLKYIDAVKFRDDINYSFVDDEELDCIFSSLYKDKGMYEENHLLNF